MTGASVLTEPIQFILGENHITTASRTSSYLSTIGVVCAGLLFLMFLVAAVLFFNNRRRYQNKTTTRVAFENPTYARGIEQVQVLIKFVIFYLCVNYCLHAF